jgi:NADH dehydrogenase
VSEQIVTVFGGTGFLGRRIVRHALDNGFRVRIAARRPERALIPPDLDRQRIERVSADIRSEPSIRAALLGAYGVVNAVSLYVERGSDTFRAVHVEAAERLARQARAAGVELALHPQPGRGRAGGPRGVSRCRHRPARGHVRTG